MIKHFMFYVRPKTSWHLVFQPCPVNWIQQFCPNFLVKRFIPLFTSELLIVTILIVLTTKKFTSFSCPKIVLLFSLAGSRERAKTGVVHCHRPNTISSISRWDSALLCLLSTRVETKKKMPPKAILVNYFVGLRW